MIEHNIGGENRIRATCQVGIMTLAEEILLHTPIALLNIHIVLSTRHIILDIDIPIMAFHRHTIATIIPTFIQTTILTMVTQEATLQDIQAPLITMAIQAATMIHRQSIITIMVTHLAIIAGKYRRTKA